MRAIPRLMLVALAAASGGQSWAQQATSGRVLLQPPPDVISSPINDRFAVRVRYYGPAVDSLVRYDSSSGVAGTLLDVENRLGQTGHKHQGNIDLMFRIGERHRIAADFYQLRRTGDRVLTGQIRFGDDVYLANDRVISDTDLRKLGIEYSYSVFRRETLEIGVGLALHLLQLQGSAEVPARFQREELDTAGPFAAPGVQLTWRMTRRFSFNAGLQYFDLTIDDVRGDFRQFHGDVQFRAWRNLAVGAGYSQTRFLVDSRNPDDFAGYFKLKYRGPQAFVRASF